MEMETTLTSPVTPATLSSALSTGSLTASLLSALPERLDDTTIQTLRDFVSSAAGQPDLPPADREHFAQVLRSLSLLKRRGDDELTGDLRFKLYWAKLCHLPRPAIEFLCSKGLERWEWFPTIKECLDLAAEWVAPIDTVGPLKAIASARINREMNLRFADVLEALAARSLDQTAIDALPSQWKAIAAERCFLWRWPDGRYTVRADMERLSEDEQAAERTRLAAMFDEWAEMALAEAERRSEAA